MQTKVLSATLAFATILASNTLAQRNRPATTQAKPAPSLLTLLPPSEALGVVKLRRALDDAMPKVLAQKPDKLAEVNTQLERLKTKTGVDARGFDELAFGMHYTYPREGITKFETVALARGTYSTEAIIAAGKAASPGSYREEKYQGKTIYVFMLNEQLKVFSVVDFQIGELAIVPLDTTRLGLGNLANVRRLIDSAKASSSANDELISLVNKDSNALASFAGNFTPQLVKSLNIENEANAKDLAAIHQIYGSLGTTVKDISLMLAARTISSPAALELSKTLRDLTNLAGLVVGRMPAPRGPVARAALSNMKITTQADELQVRTSVTHSDLGALIK